MLSIDDKFLFVHVPRTGGTYLRKQLKSMGAKKSQVGRAHTYLKTRSEVPAGTTTFSVMRNPYSWYVSYYLLFLSAAHGSAPEGFQAKFHLIPSYAELIAEAHSNVDVILRHDKLVSDLTTLLGRGFADVPINTRLLGRGGGYKQFYTPELRQQVADECSSIITEYNFKYGGK